MYYQFHLWDTDTYPKSLIESGNAEVAFCRISFGRHNSIDSIVVFNTKNEEVRSMIISGIKTINFKKFSKIRMPLLVPFVFKNFDEFANHTVQTNITDRTLAEIFDVNKKGKRKFSLKIFPPVYIRYSNEPRKR